MNCTTSELCAILGLTSARLSQLHSDGIIKPTDRNTWDIGAAVQGYVTFLTGNDSGTSPERRRLTNAQADKVEIEVALLEKRALPMEEAEAALDALIQPVRGALLGLHSKVAQQHPNLTPEVIAYIKAECRQMLADLVDSAAAAVLRGGEPSKETCDDASA